MKRQSCLFLLIVFLLSIQLKASPFIQAGTDCDPTFDRVNDSFSNLFLLVPQKEGVLYFNARIEGDVVYLDWEVEGDFDTKSFVLERRTRDEFEFVAGVRDERGERALFRKFSLQDEFETGLSPIRQYRLKQKFADGRVKYHPAITVNLFPSQDITAYPSHVSSILNLKLPQVQSSHYIISFMNSAGVLLKESRIQVDAIEQTKGFDLSNFPAGLILIRVQAGDEVWEEKVIKN